MQASVSRLLVARLLWAVLPLAASGSAPRGGWDSPNCTAGVVSVSRGEHAELACSMANPFSHVRVSLRAHPGESWQLVFDEQAPGSFRRDGWQLWVQGSEARLVIEKAQDAQAGTYRWSLAGLQRSFGTTVLNVLEPQDQLFTPSWEVTSPRRVPPRRAEDGGLAAARRPPDAAPQAHAQSREDPGPTGLSGLQPGGRLVPAGLAPKACFQEALQGRAGPERRRRAMLL
ncbi:secreted and transmembrane protein 1 [Sus scrofa]|uniref:secreted and transmembrane protein 1 n=1 Tax=Sus scrofa TaxID=9823 RepID=UPI000A2B2E19|nr:secreted and transmembrane protein 1 [Sus scrofa]